VHAQEPLDTHIILYLNRLSDYFFVLARYIAHVNGINEIKWESK
jgi:cob(I)alamin adenosyltransferase